MNQVLSDLLAHENLALWPFSKEVLWSLSFSGRPFRFVIRCSVQDENSQDTFHFDILAKVHTPNSFVATDQSLHGNERKLIWVEDTWQHFSLYLSFTKLGQPSFFQEFQFSSVLRMCCQRWYFKNSSLTWSRKWNIKGYLNISVFLKCGSPRPWWRIFLLQEAFRSAAGRAEHKLTSLFLLLLLWY